MGSPGKGSPPGQVSHWDRYPIGVGIPLGQAFPGASMGPTYTLCTVTPHLSDGLQPLSPRQARGEPQGHGDIQSWGVGREPSLSGDPQIHQHPPAVGVPAAWAAPRPEPGTSWGPWSSVTSKGCGMTLPPPKISPGADSGKVDV